MQQEQIDDMLEINARQSTQIEQLKRQINDQAHVIALLQAKLTKAAEDTDWIQQLVDERGSQLGINHSMPRGEAARLALSAVWHAHDIAKLEADHCRACCDELRQKLAAAGGE